MATALVKSADDLRRKNGASLFKVGVCAAEITKHVPTAAYQFKVVAHCNHAYRMTSIPLR